MARIDKSAFVQNFTSVAAMAEEFKRPNLVKELQGAKIFLAWYGYGDWSGDSLVIFEKDGQLYENNAGHCSCHGLEDMWSPEETSWPALAIRELTFGYEGAPEAQERLQKVVKRELRKLEKKNGR